MFFRRHDRRARMFGDVCVAFVDHGLRHKLMRRSVGFPSAIREDEVLKREEALRMDHVVVMLLFLLLGLAASCAALLLESAWGRYGGAKQWAGLG